MKNRFFQGSFNSFQMLDPVAITSQNIDHSCFQEPYCLILDLRTVMSCKRIQVHLNETAPFTKGSGNFDGRVKINVPLKMS